MVTSSLVPSPPTASRGPSALPLATTLECEFDTLRLSMAERLHPAAAALVIRDNDDWHPFALLRICNAVLLFHLQPRNDETPAVPQESGAAGDYVQYEGVPGHAGFDPAMVSS